MFVGRSTEHRERYLVPVKHRFDVLHVAHGVHGERLLELLRSTDVGINLHNEPYPSFENRVCLHLAAGNLVITEPLSPTHGLEPGIDYVEVDCPEALDIEVDQLKRFPDLYHASGSEAGRRLRRSGPRVFTRACFEIFGSTWKCSGRSGRSRRRV